MKALGLSSTISDELMRKIDGSLDELTARIKPEWRKTRMNKIAKDAKFGIRNMVILQNRHINTAGEPANKSLEKSMQSERKNIETALATLDRMTAKTEFSEYMRVNSEIVRLSPLNTNRTSAALSLGDKRKTEAECDRSLEAQQKLATK